jgi:hypothetical protein
VFSRANVIAQYANRRGLKLNETRHLMVCAEVHNLPGGNLNVIKIKRKV